MDPLYLPSTSPAEILNLTDEQITQSLIPPHKPDKVFSSGDLALISNDHIGFYVDPKVLITACPEIAKPIQNCMASTVYPSSIWFDQSSEVLRVFLNILIHQNPPSSTKIKFPLFQSVIKFAQEISSSLALSSLQKVLAEGSTSKTNDPWYVFTTGILFEDWKICGKAISRFRPTLCWIKSPKETEMDLALGAGIGKYYLDPEAIPYHYWMELPKKVSWALLRACTDRKSWSARGDRFEELMQFIEVRDSLFPHYAEMEHVEYLGHEKGDDMEWTEE